MSPPDPVLRACFASLNVSEIAFRTSGRTRQPVDSKQAYLAQQATPGAGTHGGEMVTIFDAPLSPGSLSPGRSDVVNRRSTRSARWLSRTAYPAAPIGAFRKSFGVQSIRFMSMVVAIRRLRERYMADCPVYLVDIVARRGENCRHPEVVGSTKYSWGSVFSKVLVKQRGAGNDVGDSRGPCRWHLSPITPPSPGVDSSD